MTFKFRVLFLFISFCALNTSQAQLLTNTKLDSFEIKKGNRMPDFIAFDMNNRPWQLSEVKSKKLLLCFWSKDCELCKEEMAVLNQLQNMYKEKGLTIVAYSLDSNLLELNTFVGQRKLSYVVWHNSTANNMQLLKMLNVPTVPFFYILDSRKKIIAVTETPERLLVLLNKVMN